MDERSLHDGLESLERAAPIASPPALPVSRRRPFLLWLPAGLALAGGVLIGLFGTQLLPREPGPRQLAIAPVSSGALAANCPVTRPPDPAFVPPTGPNVPPDAYGGFWHGTNALWTLPTFAGTWTLPPTDGGWYRQKTFWWSKDFTELMPDITVRGSRLDGRAQAIRNDHPTNATADFGTAMLVVVELPTPGCWELTATYRGHSLSYVVWVESRAAPTVELAWHEAPDIIAASHLKVVGNRVLATDGSEGNRGAAWYSDDSGETWTEAKVLAGPKQGDWSLGAVAQQNGRLISAGSAPNSDVGADADRRGVIWASDDQGATWTPIPEGQTSLPGDAGVVGGGPGFVMIGNPFDAATGHYTNLPAVWTSADGRDWRRTPGNPLDSGYVSGVAARGRIVAVGTAGISDQSGGTPTAWWSDDGTAWKSVVLPDTRFVAKVTTDARGFIAAGVGFDDSLQLWRSPDGETWRQVETDAGHWENVQDIASGPLGIVVSGAGAAPPPAPGNLPDPFGQPLLSFISRDAQSSMADGPKDWPATVVAMPDRFIALATTCPPNADCALQRGAAVLIGVGTVKQNPQSTPGIIALPTLESDNGGCRGVGLDATLTGDPSDPRVAWLVTAGGRRQEVVWPPGFTAQFDPDLQLLDASGAIVFHAGDHIDGGCTAGPPEHPGSLLVIRPGS